MYNTIKKLKISAYILTFAFLFIVFLRLFDFGYSSITTVGSTFFKNELSLIIDPGHGGDDGGAVSISGANESDINLGISQKLYQIMGLYGAAPKMTRASNDIDYPPDAISTHSRKVADQKARVELINSTENAVLISIHQNKFTDVQPFGAEVLFAPTSGSQKLAENLQSLLVSKLNPDNYRTASEISGDIYLMNNIDCPAVLIECGFLSNREEDTLLQSEQYQLKLAAVIASGYFETKDTLEKIYFGGQNESENDILLHRMW